MIGEVLQQGAVMTRIFGAAILVAICSVTLVARDRTADVRAEAIQSAAQDGGKDAAKASGKDAGRPEISLRVTPLITFSPAKVTVRAEFKGGARDYEPFYCTTIVWDWDDGTTSENTPDCAPYEPGTSEIRRFLSNTHTYTMAGRYNVRLRLKKGDRVVGGATTIVQVRAGIRDSIADPPE